MEAIIITAIISLSIGAIITLFICDKHMNGVCNEHLLHVSDIEIHNDSLVKLRNIAKDRLREANVKNAELEEKLESYRKANNAMRGATTKRKKRVMSNTKGISGYIVFFGGNQSLVAKTKRDAEVILGYKLN